MQPFNLGPLVITPIADGKSSVSIDSSVSIGGGSLAGVVSAEGKGSVVVDDVVLADAGLKALESKLPPALVPALELLRGFIDTELKSL